LVPSAEKVAPLAPALKCIGEVPSAFISHRPAGAELE
jgi:hypothetical protein